MAPIFSPYKEKSPSGTPERLFFMQAGMVTGLFNNYSMITIFFVAVYSPASSL
jgi:hypothetical protein